MSFQSLPLDNVLHAARKRYLDSFYLFTTELLGYTDINPDTHGSTFRCLTDNARRKLIVLPRGCFKSTIGAISWPLWLLLHNPNLRILIDSELYSNSVTYLRAIKSHLADPAFITLFGDLRGELWNEGEIVIKGRTKALKEPSITCGGVGTVRVGQHYDVIIGDDYNSPKNSATPEGCRKVIDHYRYNLSILEPHGVYVVIGTRYSALDIIGFLLEQIKLAEQKGAG